MTDYFTAFEGQRRLAAGALADVALAVKRTESQRTAGPILIVGHGMSCWARIVPTSC